MSDFWAARLGVPAAPQQQPAYQAPPQQPQGGPWWQNQALQSAPTPTPQQQAQAAQADVEGQWGTVAGSLAKAQSSKIHDHCPECGGENYFSPPGSPNAMTQCADCGYNARFQHSTAGMGVPGGESSGPATPTRQVGGTGGGGGNNYQPLNPLAGRIQ